MKKKLIQISKIISSTSSDIEENMKKYREEIIVVKYGGSAMLDPKLSETFTFPFNDTELLFLSNFIELEFNFNSSDSTRLKLNITNRQIIIKLFFIYLY